MKNIYTILLACLCITTTNILAQNTFPTNGSAGIGTTTPDASSILELKSTKQGLLVPRMTKAQRNAIISPGNGLMIYQTNNTPGFYYYNGNSWVAMNSAGTTYTAGQGISIANGVITNLGDVNAGDDITTNTAASGDLAGNFPSPQVTKLQGTPLYPIAPTTGQVLKYNGNYWLPSADSNTTYSAGNGLSLSGNVFTNTAPDQTVTLTGNGATTITGTYPNFTISSTDSNTTYSAGNGLSLSGNIFTNTAPDQTVTLTGNGAATVTGTYPNFTISSTDSNTTYSAGNGLSLSGNIFTNTAPDQTVTLTGNGATSVTGTYPNFTISSTDNNTTYTAGTGIGIAGNTITNTAPSKWNANGFDISYTNGSVGIGTPSPQYRLDVNGDINLVNALKVNGTTAFRMALDLNNIFIGANSGEHTGGNNNTAIGMNTLYLNTAGYENTATGFNALYANKGGRYNTATGNEALHSNTQGAQNTANGYMALYSNTTGSLSVANGYMALYNQTTGGDVTGIGSLADVNSGTYSNTTVLGFSATGTASDQVRIGNKFVTSIGGYVNWTTISDGRVKKNIKENIPGLAFINKLKPVTYNLNLDEADNIVQRPALKDKNGKLMQPSKDELESRNAKMKMVYTGFIAQDVERAAKSLNYDFSGVDAPKNDKDLYGIRYAEFVVPLVKAVQELSKQNDDKDARINSLEKQNNDLQKQFADLKNLVLQIQQAQQKCSRCSTTYSSASSQTSEQIASLSSASLEQNMPNPFSNATTINYTLLPAYSSAKIIITDKLGKALKEINVSGSGKGSLKIDASTLASGAYQYALYVNNKLIGTKQMLLQK